MTCWKMVEFQQEGKAVGNLTKRRSKYQGKNIEDYNQTFKMAVTAQKLSWTGRIREERREVPKTVHDEVQEFKAVVEEDLCERYQDETKY